MEMIGGDDGLRMESRRAQGGPEPSQATAEPWGKRVNRHVLLAQSAIEEISDLASSLSADMRTREEQALPDMTMAGDQDFVRRIQQRESCETTVGLVMRGVTIDSIIAGGV